MSDSDPLSDDELIARLRHAEAPPPAHDAFFDLPAAREVTVPGDGAYHGGEPGCGASARRPVPVHGAYGVPASEPISCELQAGHPGPHQAGFSRTHVLHRWHAYEWTA